MKREHGAQARQKETAPKAAPTAAAAARATTLRANDLNETARSRQQVHSYSAETGRRRGSLGRRVERLGRPLLYVFCGSGYVAIISALATGRRG